MTSTNETKILNGVSVVDDRLQYAIHVETKTSSGIFGLCASREDAVQVMRNIGRHELKILLKNTDPKWTKVSVECDDGTTLSYYKIKTQKLGYVANGSVETYANIYWEPVQFVVPSEYVEDSSIPIPVVMSDAVPVVANDSVPVIKVEEVASDPLVPL